MAGRLRSLVIPAKNRGRCLMSSAGLEGLLTQGSRPQREWKTLRLEMTFSKTVLTAKGKTVFFDRPSPQFFDQAGDIDLAWANGGTFTAADT